MAQNQNHHRNSLSRSVINYFYWLMLLQGLSFLLLGILVVMYPPAVIILVAINLLWNGITTIMLAWKVRKLRRLDPDVLAEAI
jgi:uncharacterized membrane protein HdeD (DUF308 family)